LLKSTLEAIEEIAKEKSKCLLSVTMRQYDPGYCDLQILAAVRKAFYQSRVRLSPTLLVFESMVVIVREFSSLQYYYRISRVNIRHTRKAGARG